MLVAGGWLAARKPEGQGEREEIRALLRGRLEAGLAEAAVLATPSSQDTDIGMLSAWSRARNATCGRELKEDEIARSWKGHRYGRRSC
ncbi:MAG: hypothetical protein WAW52_13960 [Methanothrix sp.]